MFSTLRLFFAVGFGCLAISPLPPIAEGHDHSRHKAEQQQVALRQKATSLAETPPQPQDAGVCQLTLRLRDRAGGKPLPGIVRVTNLNSGKAIPLPQEIHRELNWYSVPADVTVVVPQSRLRVEAIHGIDTERTASEIDLVGRKEATLDLMLRRFRDSNGSSLRGGNTHLHLMKLTYLEAIRYLQLVPQGDGLDLVFLSHLRRLPDERDYVSNQIVERSFDGGELQRLARDGVLFGNGQEHRHNFGRGGEGYGHVMLLDLLKLIQPVSIGPGIMGEGTDGRPLQSGIRAARQDGATVIWCHNTFGFEDLPNWISGLLHAQNIFDGGEHGSYRDTYYKYLNLGLRVPFSTGTDWFIYDFSRVYVPIRGELTAKKWLAGLQAGRSFITNGPLLEFTVADRPIGDTITLTGPGELPVRGQAWGRNDFRGLELVHNGEVVHTVPSVASDGHFAARLDTKVKLAGPGWLALRIPLEAGKNEFDKALFAHTSPVYIELNGQRIFRADVAQALLDDMEASIAAINRQGEFATDDERESVLRVHRAGIESLRQRLKQAAAQP